VLSIKFYRSRGALGAQVITRTDGRALGVVAHLFVDPRALAVVSLSLRAKGLGGGAAGNMPLAALCQARGSTLPSVPALPDLLNLLRTSTHVQRCPVDSALGSLPGVEVHSRCAFCGCWRLHLRLQLQLTRSGYDDTLANSSVRCCTALVRHRLWPGCHSQWHSEAGLCVPWIA